MNLDVGQLSAVGRLKNGSILVGGVGSGKSRTGLTYFFTKECKGSICINQKGSYSPMKEPKDLYIITTAKKRDEKEWERELAPFCLYPIDEAEIKIVIDSWQNLPKYINVMNSFFIFDEQRLVSYGKWTKTFLRISKNNHWIMLSATPADKWEDLAPVFIANGFYKNITEFRARHIQYKRFSKFPQVERYINTGRLIALRENVYIDLPYQNERVQHHEYIYTDYDKDTYKFISKNRYDPFLEEPLENISQLAYLLRKVVNSDSSRLNELSKLMDIYPRLIVFYNFDYELDELRLLAENRKITRAEWNGHLHQPVPETATWIYLVQYTAGAEAWNCITTNAIVFFSQNYSYKTMIQAAGRIDRRNSPFTDLYYYHIISRAPIDMAILRALKNKKKFNERSFFS